ncbi:MAG: Ig domain-containing protein [Gemmatimonadales bacterium]|nr:Ig domain-containing protein [Gemmatimonadales bacterium]
MRRLLVAFGLLAACSSSPTTPAPAPPPPPPPPPPPAAVASVAVEPGTASVVPGGTVTLTATPRDAGGAALQGRTVTWATSNATIASVSSAGVVTGVAAGGPVTITATSEGQSGSAQVTVTPPPVATVAVAPGTSALTIGATATLVATVRDAAGAPLTGRTVSWASSNEEVATVSETGLVTAVAIGGPVTITATSEGVNGTAQVTVEPVASASWASSTEARISTIDPVISFSAFSGVVVGTDGSALATSQTQVFERAANGAWNTTGTTLPGIGAVISAHIDPAGRGWVSGTNGVLYRRTAPGVWVQEVTGTSSQAIYAVAIRADGSGVAVGNPGGTIRMRSAAGVWSAAASGTSALLGSVAVGGPSFALAAGTPITSTAGTVLRWNGTAWAALALPVSPFRPRHIVLVSDTEAYITGVSGGAVGTDNRVVILRWNGTALTVLHQGPVTPWINIASATRCPNGAIYVAESFGRILRVAGGTVEEFVAPRALYADFAAILCEPDNRLVVAVDAFERLVLRQAGSGWETLRWLPDLTTVALGGGGNEVMATNGSVARRAGGQWVRNGRPRTSIPTQGVASKLWASGTSAVIGGEPAGHFTGTEWVWGPDVPARGAQAIWGASPTQVFAVGQAGVIDVFNGAAWSTTPIPAGGPSALTRLRGAGGFALGHGGAAPSGVQWNGTSWSVFAATPPGGWGEIEVFSSTDVINVNASGIAAWNGASWTLRPNSAVTGTIRAVVARSANDVYVFRDADILHYNGATLATVGTVNGTVRAAARHGNEVIAVGDGGLVLRATLP